MAWGLRVVICEGGGAWQKNGTSDAASYNLIFEQKKLTTGVFIDLPSSLFDCSVPAPPEGRGMWHELADGGLITIKFNLHSPNSHLHPLGGP